jgi:hypothetical protein
MPAGIALALLLAISQTAPASTPDTSATTTEDIVVVARRGDSCEVRFADKTMTDAELRAHTRAWAQGTPVRVMARSNADLSCLKKIAFKLAAQGVTRMEFVDPSGKPAPDVIPNADAPPRVTDTPRLGGIDDAGMDAVRSSERNFIARRAARLILQGDCAGARKLALEAEDLQTAANVAQVCASR